MYIGVCMHVCFGMLNMHVGTALMQRVYLYVVGLVVHVSVCVCVGPMRQHVYSVEPTSLAVLSLKRCHT